MVLLSCVCSNFNRGWIRVRFISSVELGTLRFYLERFWNFRTSTLLNHINMGNFASIVVFDNSSSLNDSDEILHTRRVMMITMQTGSLSISCYMDITSMCWEIENDKISEAMQNSDVSHPNIAADLFLYNFIAMKIKWKSLTSRKW